MFGSVFKNLSLFVEFESSIRTQNFFKKQEFENSVITKVAWSMKHYFGGILRRIYKPSKKFFIKSPWSITYGHFKKKSETLKITYGP
jgi:hypothetical protein